MNKITISKYSSMKDTISIRAEVKEFNKDINLFFRRFMGTAMELFLQSGKTYETWMRNFHTTINVGEENIEKSLNRLEMMCKEHNIVCERK